MYYKLLVVPKALISVHLTHSFRVQNTEILNTLRWRHNGCDSVSNHQPRECLLRRLIRRTSKKTSKLRVTGLCVGNSPGPVNSPHKGPVTRKMFPFDDVIMKIKMMYDAYEHVPNRPVQISVIYPQGWNTSCIIDGKVPGAKSTKALLRSAVAQQTSHWGRCENSAKSAICHESQGIGPFCGGIALPGIH